MKKRTEERFLLRREFLFTLTSFCLVGCKIKKTPIPNNRTESQDSLDKVQVLETVSNCQSTIRDIEGPFYIPNAPIRNKLNIFDEKGTVVKMSGRIFISDCNQGSSGVFLEVWHANTSGEYDNTSTDMKYRCRMKTDEKGFYELTTILPGRYKNGRTYRPRHFHIKIIDSENIEHLTTQIYFKGDSYIETDPFVHVSNVVDFKGSEETMLEAQNVDFFIV